jgi:hypothetical protein
MIGMIVAARMREGETAARRRTTRIRGGKKMIFSFAVLFSMGDLTTASASGLRNLNFHVTSGLQAVYDLSDHSYMFPDPRPVRCHQNGDSYFPAR